jgi:hypothetical protein
LADERERVLLDVYDVASALGGIGGPGQTDRAVFPAQRYDDVRGSTTGDGGLTWATSPTNRQRVRPGGDLEPIRQTVVAEREVQHWLSGFVGGSELDWHRPLDLSHSPQVDDDRCGFGDAAAPKGPEQR